MRPNVKAESIVSTCVVYFYIRTSSVVYPGAELVHAAKQTGAIRIETNPNETPLSQETDVVFRMSASQALAIMDEYRRQAENS